jgi:hypothetical protein
MAERHPSTSACGAHSIQFLGRHHIDLYQGDAVSPAAANSSRSKIIAAMLEGFK